MKKAFLFPGQGAQFPGMGKDLWEKSKTVKDIFDTASKASGLDVTSLIFDGTAEDLKATDKSQTAITAVSMSASALLREKGIKAGGTAGFSLGEYAALAECGVVSKDDVFPLIKARGDIMESVSRSADTPEGKSGMAAVIGLSLEQTETAIRDAEIANLYVANYNSPSQVVVSGTAEALKEGQNVLKEAGAKRVIPLKVSGPFHCPLLEDAKKEFSEVLSRYDFSDPAIPFFSNVTGHSVNSGEEIKRLCAEQLVSTVRWVDVEESLVGAGFSDFLEVGPGKVLTGLLKAFSRDLTCKQAGTIEQIESL